MIINYNYNPTSVHSCVYVPIPLVYPSILLVNHIRGTVFKLLYINISNDSGYSCCPDEERFYTFKILAFRTLKLQLFPVVVFAFNQCYFSFPMVVGFHGNQLKTTCMNMNLMHLRHCKILPKFFVVIATTYPWQPHKSVLWLRTCLPNVSTKKFHILMLLNVFLLQW